MHFWIDKRSQACGFNGRHGVPASLASGKVKSSHLSTAHFKMRNVKKSSEEIKLSKMHLI